MRFDYSTHYVDDMGTEHTSRTTYYSSENLPSPFDRLKDFLDSDIDFIETKIVIGAVTYRLKGKQYSYMPNNKLPWFPALCDPLAHELFEILRSLRRELAGKESVPAYHILEDKVLKTIVAYRPVSYEHFARIPGVGERRLERYYELFSTAIRTFAEERCLPVDREYAEAMDDAERVDDVPEEEEKLPVDKLSSWKYFELTDLEKQLCKMLRQIRLQLAESQGEKPYQIVSERTIQSFAAYRPITQEHFARIYNIGRTKLALYFKPFSEVIRLFAEEHLLRTNLEESEVKLVRES